MRKNRKTPQTAHATHGETIDVKIKKKKEKKNQSNNLTSRKVRIRNSNELSTARRTFVRKLNY